jgi:hypothetical protein
VKERKDDIGENSRMGVSDHFTIKAALRPKWGRPEAFARQSFFEMETAPRSWSAVNPKPSDG